MPSSGWDRKSTRLNSSHLGISYAVFCLKKKTELRAVNTMTSRRPEVARVSHIAFRLARGRRRKAPSVDKYNGLDNPQLCFFFFNDTATTEIYTLSLHDALPICCRSRREPRLLLPADCGPALAD